MFLIVPLTASLHLCYVFEHHKFLITVFVKTILPITHPVLSFKLFFKIYLFIWLCWVFVAGEGFSPVVGSRGDSLAATASHCGAEAQKLWRTGLVAAWHVGSSPIRGQTHVSCMGRQVLNQGSPVSCLFN